MLHDIITKGSVDRSVTVRIIDATDGTPETGVAFDTAGIDLWYRREGAALVSIVEATLADLTAAHADGGFLHIADGVYRLDLPDAAFANGANHVDFGGTVTGMVVIGGHVRLVDYSLEDSVRMGLTALPNAAADAAGGLPISDAGGLDMDAIKADTAAILLDTAEIGAAGAGLTALASASDLATVAQYLDTEIAAILADTNELQTDWTNGGRLDLILDAAATQTSVDDLPTNAELAAALAAADDAVLAAVATVDGVVDAILVTTDKLDDTLEDDGGTFRFTAAALAEAPGGTAPSAADIAQATWDEAVDGATTARESMRLQNSVLGGKSSGFDGSDATYRDLADTKDRVVATVDADGNRTAVTRDLT